MLRSNNTNCSAGNVLWSVAGNVSGVRMNQICTLFLALDRLYALYRPFAYRVKNHLKIAQFVITISFLWSVSEVAANALTQDLNETKSSCTTGVAYTTLYRYYRIFSNLVLNLGTQLLYAIVFCKIRKLGTEQSTGRSMTTCLTPAFHFAKESSKVVVIVELIDAPLPATPEGKALPPLAVPLRSAPRPIDDLLTYRLINQLRAQTYLLDYDRPTLDMINTYLTFHNRLSTGLEGHPIRAMRILLKMIKSQRFANKVYDFYISRTAGGAFGTTSSSSSGRPSEPTVTFADFQETDLPATARPVYDCSDPPCCSYSYSY
uniref:G-protein coupled receptors family 1 profile domain-containing protein n=1 Tax=Plectus sambesii TaxID=2011161 RepID=A0A914WUN9_9BILA